MPDPLILSNRPSGVMRLVVGADQWHVEELTPSGYRYVLFGQDELTAFLRALPRTLLEDALAVSPLGCEHSLGPGEPRGQHDLFCASNPFYSLDDPDTLEKFRRGAKALGADSDVYADLLRQRPCEER